MYRQRPVRADWDAGTEQARTGDESPDRPAAAAAADLADDGDDPADDGTGPSITEQDGSDSDDDDGEGVHAVELELDQAADEEDEDDSEWEEEDEEEDEEAVNLTDRASLIRVLMGRNHPRNCEALRNLPRLSSQTRPALAGDLAAALNRTTSARDIGQANNIWPCLDAGCDSSQLCIVSTRQQRRILEQQEEEQPAGKTRCTAHQQQQPQRHHHDAPAQQQQQHRSGAGSYLSGLVNSLGASITTRGAARRQQAAAATAAEEGPGGGNEAARVRTSSGGSSSSSSSDGSNSSSSSGFRVVNTTQLLLKREVFMGRQAGLSRGQQQHLCCSRSFPLQPQQVRDNLQSRAYIGQFSASGDFFIAAYQDRRVRLYDTNANWLLRKDVTTRMTRWTITDTALSPDQRLLAYASISPVAFVVNVGSSTWDMVDSQANITELHEPLAVDGSAAPGADRVPRNRHTMLWDDDDDDGGAYYTNSHNDFGIWSIAWSPQGGQLIAGTNDNSVYVYDIESKRCLVRLTGHEDDVNAVAYLDPQQPDLLLSGCDDHCVRLWDIRDRRGSARRPQGVLVGHTEGLTHICPKGDGVHLISNSKDQTIKLWDVRAALSPSAASTAEAQARQQLRIPRWDYRWEKYPGAAYDVKHPSDCSLMTYRGHQVLQTLIRAYFSPEHTTGQRYIYGGSADGIISAWDVVSGQRVAEFEYHHALVRDCSWHPYEPELASVSWDGRVVSWGPNLPGGSKGGSRSLLSSGRGDVGRYY